MHHIKISSLCNACGKGQLRESISAASSLVPGARIFVRLFPHPNSHKLNVLPNNEIGLPVK